MLGRVPDGFGLASRFRRARLVVLHLQSCTSFFGRLCEDLGLGKKRAGEFKGLGGQYTGVIRGVLSPEKNTATREEECTRSRRRKSTTRGYGTWRSKEERGTWKAWSGQVKMKRGLGGGTYYVLAVCAATVYFVR
jgi:hypothetical protein